VKVIFGGPDKPPGVLRDLLLERTASVPAGGEILWATYYLRSGALADALIGARRRGAGIKVCLEAAPRLRTANDAVRRQLSAGDGLGSGFRAVGHLLPMHLHSKIYFFSHPVPTAFVGSFNPSGNEADEPDIIAEIGDQDRGHNYLVEITEPAIVQGLRAYVERLHGARHGLLEHLAGPANDTPTSDQLTVFFFPRRRSSVVADALRQPGIEQVRIAASHFRDSNIARHLARLTARGKPVEIIAHDTPRRVPTRIEAFSRRSGVRFWRYCHPMGLPMHNKFVLLAGPHLRRVLFGSMNLTRTSRWLNHEVLVQADDLGLFEAFAERWEHMRAEVQEFSAEA
jgi:phosphatidylserine/phosphatidylglycerophosphate/cardiolipin synthase-like enzyme